MSDMDIRTIRVSEKGQISIPKEVRKSMKIKKGDSLIMLVKKGRIVLEKSDSIGFLLDNRFKDVKSFSEESLKKLWLNRRDERWSKYAKKTSK